MANAEDWTCPTCQAALGTPYCGTCGEERLRPQDLTLRDLAEQMAKGLSSIDGKLLRSFRSVLTAPGALTAAHLRGERRSFLGPLALFFVANALFVATQSLTGTNVLSSPLHSHLHIQDWSPVAQTLVEDRLASRPGGIAAYAPVFDKAAIFNAKALMILMVLAFAPFLFPIFQARHRPTGAHLVFALHLYTFVLSLLCLSLLLAEAQLLLGGDGMRSPLVDLVLSLFNVTACAVYIHLAIGPAYGAVGLPRLAKAVLLTVIVAALFIAYRFAIFLITLYSS